VEAAAQVMAAKNPGCRIHWSLLAGIGRVESSHGRFGGAVVAAGGQVSPPIYGPLLDGSAFARISDTDSGRWDGDAVFDRAVGPMQIGPDTWQGSAGTATGTGSSTRRTSTT
jgi:membrane-bound lytic murein transglycosylase B